jgi:polysaccharide export outer membrane protein
MPEALQFDPIRAWLTKNWYSITGWETTMRRVAGWALMPMMAATLLNGCASSTPDLKPDIPGQIATYTLGAGDRLRVTVYNEPGLTGEFAVTGDGNISYPLIGNLAVAGKSIQQTQDLIRSRLGVGYVNDPRVTIEVVNYRPYYMLGEIGRPGQYPFAVGLTITQAVSVAGGFSYRANKKTIYVKRADDAVERKIDVSKNTAYVLPGDTIRVGERYF